MTFESLTLTPFCTEILNVRKWMFKCLCGFGLNKVKYARICPLSLFLQFFADIPFLFLQGEINCWGERDRKISGPVSAPVSAHYMTFGSKGWTALFDLVDLVGPKI